MQPRSARARMRIEKLEKESSEEGEKKGSQKMPKWQEATGCVVLLTITVGKN